MSNSIDINIVEMVNDGSGSLKPWEDITNAMPGMTYSAMPQVKNDSSVLVSSIRMCLFESATDSAGQTITLPANTFEINVNNNWTLDAEASTNSADPAVGNCYNYNSSLNPGAMTEPLFNEVTLSSALGNEYQGATFNLHIEAQARGEDEEQEQAETVATATGKPDTGANTAEESFVMAIPYILGALALLVIMIHLIKGFIKRAK